MSCARITRELSFSLEIRCQCRDCGGSVYSECGEHQSGSPLVVKVAPFCAGCLRERERREQENNNVTGGK